ncbi:hypothetical protein NDU88_009056 [Pleurodeles waltl]|uniref:Integrase zinc-binding domain-containing protein n=1 Tax=Pleurodeles waltl TaxID=8319 RepID=A0AAV7RXG3_PLEWA|nr:hypothetical protein NDU88_009056 [Pleurodeles waltl]
MLRPCQMAMRVEHQVHAYLQGIVKSKSHTQRKVWSPQLDEKAEGVVKKCLMCEAKINQPEFPGHIITGKYLRLLGSEPVVILTASSVGDTLIVIDEYLKYSEVEIVSSITADEAIPYIEKLVVMQGLIHEIHNDNGLTFQKAN